MKVTGARVFIVPAEISASAWVNGDPWILVEVMTDAGVSGWGQAHTTAYEREHAIARNVCDLARDMHGTSPFDIKQFMVSMAERIATSEAGIEIAAAVAGLEIALWDIVGKALNKPVHDLMGERCKERVSLYANCWSNRIRSPDEVSAFAAQQVRRGFRAVKIYPFLYGVSISHGVACISAVRDVVGPDVAIFVDMLESMPDGEHNVLFEALRRYDISWLEDPTHPENIEQLCSIRRASRVPIVTGEQLYQKRSFTKLCETDGVDILNPEVALLGILGVKEIASIAEAHGKKITVHNANTMTIGLAAALQAAAVIPNSRWVEFFPTLESGSNSFSNLPFDLDKDGSVAVPVDPGLGVSVDHRKLRHMEYHLLRDADMESE